MASIPPPTSFFSPPSSSINTIPFFSLAPPFRLINYHLPLKLMPTSPPSPTSRPCFPPSSRNASTCDQAQPQRHSKHVEEYEEDSWHFWNGPSPGDLAEVEAFCRIFRIAEQLHNAVISALCSTDHSEDYEEEILDDDDVMPSSDPSDRECIPFYEEKVVAGLGCIGALLHQQKQEVLGGRLSRVGTLKNMDKTVQDETKPPLAHFRGEMKKCCELLEAALSSYFPPVDEQSISIHRRLQRLRNVCFDAGYPRLEGSPSHSDIPNWAAVRLWPGRGGRISEKDEEVAFWRGGQITEEGLNWLLNRGIKVIVDLRAENGMDQLAKAAVDRAMSLGKIKVVRLPVEPGTAPTMEQVEDFARLVAAPENRHIYLHSQEGIGRTSAMVSRWRELTHRRGQHVMAEASCKTNGNHGDKVLEEDATYVRVGADNVLTSLTVEEASDLEFHKNDDGSKFPAEDINGTAFHSFCDDAPVTSCKNHKDALEFRTDDSGHVGGLGITDGAISENSGDTMGNQGSGIELGAINPFEAQRPALNALSRRAMSQFWKQKRVVPAGYMFRKRETKENSFSASIDENGIGLFGSIAGPAGRWALAEPGIPRAGVKTEGLDSQAKTKALEQGGHSEKDDNAEICKDLNGRLGTADRVDDASCQDTVGKPVIEASLPPSSRNKSSNGSLVRVCGDDAPADDSEEASVAGDMCASTTGVVRLQSRKKAEMYLVRTDGFSCTREKVKESTLAFTHPSTQQQMLMWKTAPKTVLLLKKLGNELMEEAKQVASFLHYQEGMNVVVEPEVHDRFARFPGFGFVQTFYNQNTSDLHERVDFVVCLGGDGVILHASNLFRNAVPPVVSFSLGSLGFLTAHPFDDFKLDLRAIIHGNSRVEGVYITLRMRLRCELFRNGKPIPGKVFDVLNEVVVDRGSNPYLCKIECFERNRLITKVQADGVIVATPTGSTAYSTSAGGSMVHPNVPCMLFTPICPHSLSFRPVILPDSALLEMKVPSDARSNAWVSFDGKRRQQLSKGDSVRICMSEHPLPTVNKSDQTDDWFRSLVRCLNWNERLEQKALTASL